MDVESEGSHLGASGKGNGLMVPCRNVEEHRSHSVAGPVARKVTSSNCSYSVEGHFQMRHRSAILALVGLWCCLASQAHASNMGFTYHLTVSPRVGATTLTWLALPWQYSPADAEALCADVRNGTTSVDAVVAWDEPSSRFLTYTCGSGSGAFTLHKGIAYGVVGATGQGVDTTIVGTHDDVFGYSIAPTAGSNLTFVSIPYHQHIPDVAGTAGVVDAEDLCRSVGTALWAVLRWDDATGTWVAYACGSSFVTPFPIQLGVGYGLVNAAGQTITWHPSHY